MAHAHLSAINPPQVIQRCTKVAYDSRKMAMRKLSRHRKSSGLAASGAGVMKVYKCFCGAFHIGHLERRFKPTSPMTPKV
jgi:hypothetical protein